MSMSMSIEKVSSTPAQDALLRAWIWLSFHRKTRFVLAVLLVCFISQMTNATMALADDDDDDATSLNTYLLPLSTVTDTHGVPLGKYTELPLDYGQGTYIVRIIRGVLVRIGWMIYTVLIYSVLALCNFILSLEWVDWVLSPFILLANTIQGLMASTGIIGLGIFVAALTIAWGLARGKMGAAMLEIAIVAVFVGLVASPLANPSAQIKSWISTSSNYGTDAGSQTVLGTETGAVLSTNPVSGQIVDIAVRNPALMLSFGSTLEGDACSTKWDETAKAGKKAEKLRKTVLSCNSALKPANETDSFTIFAFLAMSGVSSGGLLALVIVFVVFIIKDVLLAGLGLVNTVLRAHLAIFPGGGRQAFVNAFLQLVVNVVMVGAYIFMLSLYLWMVGKLYAALGGTVMMIGNLIFGLLLICLAVTFWQFKRQGKSLAKKLSKVLGGSPMNKAADLKPSIFAKGASQAAGLGKGIVKEKYKAAARRKAFLGLQAGLAAATGGASVAATRTVKASAFMAEQVAKKTSPNAAAPDADSAPMAPDPAASAKPLAIAPRDPNAMRDRNGSIPLGSNSSSERGDDANQDEPNESRMLTGSRRSALALEKGESSSSEPSISAETMTPADSVEPKAPVVQDEPKDGQRTTLPTGQYGNVRVNRDGSTNNVLSGQVVDTLPEGIKAARSWEAPADEQTKKKTRRKASMDTAAYRMMRASLAGHTADLGENR